MRNNHIPVTVNLKMAKPHKYSFGLGYGTDTGIRGSYGWEWRYVTPTGHYLQTLLRVSQERNDNFQARYVIPGKNPVRDSYALTAGVFTNRPGTGDDKYTTGQVGANYTTIIHDNWQQTVALQFQHERFTVDNTQTTSNTILPSIVCQRLNI